MGTITPESIISDLRYLQLLSRSFPTIADASTEIINLEAILNLPDGYSWRVRGFSACIEERFGRGKTKSE